MNAQPRPLTAPEEAREICYKRTGHRRSTRWIRQSKHGSRPFYAGTLVVFHARNVLLCCHIDDTVASSPHIKGIQIYNVPSTKIPLHHLRPLPLPPFCIPLRPLLRLQKRIHLRHRWILRMRAIIRRRIRKRLGILAGEIPLVLFLY
jgi:hypothetical protein